MIDNYVAVIVNHRFNLLQILGADVMLLGKHKLLSVPNKFSITTLADHVNVNRLMFMAKEHKYKAVGSKNFWHKIVVLGYCWTKIGIVFDTCKYKWHKGDSPPVPKLSNLKSQIATSSW